MKQTRVLYTDDMYEYSGSCRVLIFNRVGWPGPVYYVGGKAVSHKRIDQELLNKLAILDMADVMAPVAGIGYRVGKGEYQILIPDKEV